MFFPTIYVVQGSVATNMLLVTDHGHRFSAAVMRKSQSRSLPRLAPQICLQNILVIIMLQC